MRTLVFKKNHTFRDGSIFYRGEEGMFQNNESHFLIENGIAVLKELYKPPADKMVRRRSKKVKTKRL